MNVAAPVAPVDDARERELERHAREATERQTAADRALAERAAEVTAAREAGR